MSFSADRLPPRIPGEARQRRHEREQQPFVGGVSDQLQPVGRDHQVGQRPQDRHPDVRQGTRRQLTGNLKLCCQRAILSKKSRKGPRKNFL